MFVTSSLHFIYYRLRFQLEERQQLESKIESLEENLRLTNGVLGRTQALLLTEHNNCQQMALHIDLLRVNYSCHILFQ